MKRKSYRMGLILALAASVAFAAGCSGKTSEETVSTEAAAETTEGETSAPAETEPERELAPEVDGYTASFEIIKTDSSSMIVTGTGETEGLYSVGHGPIQADADGYLIQVSDLRPGMMVELTWDGTVQESWPGQFSYEKLEVLDESGSRELSFYYQLLKDLGAANPELNEGAAQVYFDFSKVASLTDAEKEGLAYVCSSSFGEGLGELATEEELMERGFMDGAMPDTILVSVTEVSNEGNSLACSAWKYRSDQGGSYFSDVRANYSEESQTWVSRLGS